MALVVENGTGLPGANSYVAVAEARQYAADRGLSLPATDPAVEVLLVRATEYLETAPRGPWQGDKTFPSVDTLSWPRIGVVIDGYELAQDEVPLQLKKALCQLAVEMQTVDPTPTLTGNVVKRKKVDVIETEYAIDYRAGQKPPTMTKVNGLLQPLLRASGMLRVTRI